VLWFLIAVVFDGLIVGALARLAVPGPDPMSLWMTVGIGILGSFVGGLAAKLFFGFVGGFLFALGGAVLLVILYRRLVQHRPITGPEAHRWPR